MQPWKTPGVTQQGVKDAAVRSCVSVFFCDVAAGHGAISGSIGRVRGNNLGLLQNECERVVAVVVDVVLLDFFRCWACRVGACREVDGDLGYHCFALLCLLGLICLFCLICLLRSTWVRCLNISSPSP